MRRACARSSAPGGGGGFGFMSSSIVARPRATPRSRLGLAIRDQAKRLVERAGAGGSFEIDDPRPARGRVTGRDAEVDPAIADDQAPLAREPREVPRELRAGRAELGA